MTSTCSRCAAPLPWRLAGGRPALYCGGACRVAAHRARRRAEQLATAELTAAPAADDRLGPRLQRVAAERREQQREVDELATAFAPIPAELKSGARWVRWRTITRGGRPTKLPLTVDGDVASSTDPSTWSTFERAAASSVGDGMGVVLLATDDVVCVDLDHVLVDGHPLPAAARLLGRLPRTWVEVSPSGDGLHVWGRASSLRAGRRTVTAAGVSLEAYPHGRYITVTGRRFADAPLALADLDDVLAALLG